jgi:hypothetical protein
VTTRAERRYRRLLRAYPRSYRDHRGTEILTTLLEMAEDGRRPAAGFGNSRRVPKQADLSHSDAGRVGSGAGQRLDVSDAEVEDSVAAVAGHQLADCDPVRIRRRYDDH